MKRHLFHFERQFPHSDLLIHSQWETPSPGLEIPHWLRVQLNYTLQLYVFLSICLKLFADHSVGLPDGVLNISHEIPCTFIIIIKECTMSCWFCGIVVRLFSFHIKLNSYVIKITNLNAGFFSVHSENTILAFW